MRLRLCIERNELPSVNILWAIRNTDLRQTVAQFLERVNERFPLEDETWGLEDYAVVVGGYEALHYHELGNCFQNEDEVVIKPLQYVDERARTMTGRKQISQDGRHLVDGVPFGKPLLKRVIRPIITIPPRKRQRLDNEEVLRLEDSLFGSEDDDEYTEEHDTEEELEKEVTPARTKQRRHVDNEAEDEDEDSEDSEDEEHNPEQESDEDEVPYLPRNTTRQRSFDEDQDDSEDEASSSPSDLSDSSSEDNSSDSSSDSFSDSDDKSDATEESWNGIDKSDSEPSPVRPLGFAQSQQETPAQPDTPPEQLSSCGLPFMGQEKTRHRNARRREQRKLKHLKEVGTLPVNATLSNMHAWLEEHEMPSKANLQRQTVEKARQRLLDQIRTGGVDVAPGTHGNLNVETLNEELTTAADRQGNIVLSSLSKHRNVADVKTPQVATVIEDEILPKTAEATTTTVTDPVTVGESPDTESPIFQRRKRLDAASTNRLIFGSLGVRTPKTQEEKDALQKKLAVRPTRSESLNVTAKIQQAAGNDEDLDAWRDKIDLFAVECCDENVTLSQPPFPFKQRWDPQYQHNRKKHQKKRRHAHTNSEFNEEFIETYDKYNVDGNDALNYDDPDEDELDDEYWEDGALLGDQYESETDGFPDLPADVATLPSLDETDAKQGDIIVFEELACSAATGWQPKTIVRTVRLDSNDGDGWHVKFATRDLRPREFDEEGNRIYSKFEMEGLSDDEGDEHEKSLLWNTMTNVRLLQRRE